MNNSARRKRGNVVVVLIAVAILSLSLPHALQAVPLKHAVAISGDYAVVGASWTDDFKGAVEVMKRDGQEWVEVQRLQPDGLGRHDHFGASVAIDGDRIVVGAPWQNSLRGAVYVFSRLAGEWVLEERLAIDSAPLGHGLGWSIAFGGDVLTILAGGRDAGGSSVAYRFERVGSAWSSGTAIAPRDSKAAGNSPDAASVAAVIAAAPSDVATRPVQAQSVPQPPDVVSATDGVFEDEVRVSWSKVPSDAIIYKILRDNVLISIASSEDSLYVDETGTRGVVYDYCVVVEDMGGLESAPRCDAGSRIVYAPADVVATDGDLVDGVRVTWDDRSAVESGYYLKRDGVSLDTLGVNARTALDTSAVLLTTYSYEVVAFDADGGESAPGVDTGFRGIVLPPLNVDASDGEYADSVVVTWTDQTDAEAGFIVSRTSLSTADSTVLDTTVSDVHSYADATAQQGVRYRYCVTTLDLIGQRSIPGCDEGGVDFPAPANVQASDSTCDDRVEITWDDPSNLEDGFQISRDGSPIDTTAADATSYQDTDAVPGTTHTYCVAALSDMGGVSAAACDDGFRSVVLAPTGVSATDGTFEDHVDITWESASTTVVVFKISRDGAFIKSVGPGSRKYSDSGGTANHEYTYGVQALTALAEASATAEDAGRRDLHAPDVVSASDDEFEDRVEITWRDNSRFEDGFAIYRTPDGTPGAGALVGESGSNVTNFVDLTGVPGTRYKYSVAAFDTDGEARGESDVAGDTGRRVLAAPQNVAASDGSYENHVEVTWEDESNVEDGYRVYRNGVLIHSSADNTTTFVDATPPFGAISEYSVRAFDALGESKADADSGFTTVLAPGSFNASDSYTDAVVLRWVDLSEVEDMYVIQTDSADVVVRIDTLAAGATSFTDARASTNTTYDYRIRAIAGAAVSEEASATGSRFVPTTAIPSTPLADKLAITKDTRSTPDTDGFAEDQFGWAMAIEGDVLIVGSPGDNPRGTNSGSAYAFERNPDLTWTQVDNFWAEQDGQGGDRFGEAVAFTGDTAIIGMPGRSSYYGTDDSKYGSGVALVFRRSPDGTWYEQSVLSPEGEPVNGDPMAPSNSLDRFGSSIAMGERSTASTSGTSVWVVGAPGDDFQNTGTNINVGAIYFYPGGKKHFASDGADGDSLGACVSVAGDWAVAGAPGCDDNGTQSGAAYVYHFFVDSFGRDVWDERAKLVASDGAPGQAFGSSVLRNGDLTIVGAPRDAGVDDGPGAVYVFRLDPGDSTWVQEAILHGSGSGPDRFGSTLAINTGRLVVGAPGEGEGAFYVFLRGEHNEWSIPSRFTAADGEVGDGFGSAVAVGSEWAFAGAPNDDVDVSVDAGSVHSLLMLSSVTDVTASDGTFPDRVHIEWQDHSQSEEGVIVYRDGVEYDRLGPNESFYDDLDAEPGRTYKYQVSPISEFAGFAPVRVPDFGWRPPDGHISGSVTSPLGDAVSGVSVCLDPPGTGALLFDGVGGHVRIPDDGTFDFSASEPFTIEVWFSYAGSDRSPRIISKLSDNGTDSRPIDLGLQRTGRLFFVMSDGVNFARVMSQRSNLGDDT